jgi:hypothetical protein
MASNEYLDKIDDCTKIPSKGGIPFETVKTMAKEMNIDITGKTKAELCDEIRKLLNKPIHQKPSAVGSAGPTQPEVAAEIELEEVIAPKLPKPPRILPPPRSWSRPQPPQPSLSPPLSPLSPLSPLPPLPPLPQQPTLIRVGQSQMRKSYPTAQGFLQIPAWSRGKGIYRQLSPFFLGPIDYDGLSVKTFESLWQHSKVYRGQVDAQGNPTQVWYNWRNAGFGADAERHPMGKEIPLYSYFNGEKLDVVEARKKIYIPYYKELVRETPAYKELLARLKAGLQLLLIEPDGPFLQDFPEGVPIDRELFKQLIGVTDQKTFYSLIGKPYPHAKNRYFPLGHGYVLADALLEDLGF